MYHIRHITDNSTNTQTSHWTFYNRIVGNKAYVTHTDNQQCAAIHRPRPKIRTTVVAETDTYAILPPVGIHTPYYGQQYKHPDQSLDIL